MHKKFNHEEIEQRWQKIWKESGIYNVGARDTSKEKEFVLVEWPYPSGNLHVGHWFAFAVVDIYVRARRMQGKQVLFPIGFDAFGLPAENAAIKHGLNPKTWTESNIAHMKTQLESMGAAFSWDKTTSSIDTEYYKWTQWMFTQFFEHDIAYRGTGIVNWCPGCNTVIANEQVLTNNTCERSGDAIEKREMPQWMIRITKYADKLIDDLDTLEWPLHIKEAQRQWIGRSQGAEITFKLSTGDDLTVFTTRPDTLYGVTYMVLAPEHPLVTKLLTADTTTLTNASEVQKYVEVARNKSDIDRTNAHKEKTGIVLEGVQAINPATGETIPVFVADYVLAGYGTGAIMAVPAHDERDFAFAKKFDISIRNVIAPIFNKKDTIRRTRTAVYAVIKNEKDEILIQNFKARNYFWLPGGGVEGSESEEECLRREIKEEAGFSRLTHCTRALELFYDFTDDSGNDGRNRSIIYTVTVDSNDQGEINHTPEETAKELTEIWVKPDDISKVIASGYKARSEFINYVLQHLHNQSIYAEFGGLINSAEFDGMSSEEAKVAITKKVGGKLTNTYRLRDWSIGRQRYWGVPIPIVYDPEGNAHVIPKEHLPWHLPTDVDFTPTGVAPLAKSIELKERVERIFGKGWTPEVETMDTFVDSSWYFLRYLDAQNDTELISKEAQNEWMPIDTYFGGSEHTTMHLLYSRFWQKALFDLGLVTLNEPYKHRINRGLVLGPDGNKMSKSKGNVIDPDEQVKRLGADTVRMYLAFMGPYGEASNYPWSIDGIVGLRRFLERVYGLKEHVQENIETEEDTRHILHVTIKKISDDIATYKFNTAISQLMILMNHLEKLEKGIPKDVYETFLILIAPFAPHLAEELWAEEGKHSSIHHEMWPSYNSEELKLSHVTISVQVNGKMRGTVTVPHDSEEATVLEFVRGDAHISTKITGEIIRVIFVKNKIINLIVTGT